MATVILCPVLASWLLHTTWCCNNTHTQTQTQVMKNSEILKKEFLMIDYDTKNTLMYFTSSFLIKHESLVLYRMRMSIHYFLNIHLHGHRCSGGGVGGGDHDLRDDRRHDHGAEQHATRALLQCRHLLVEQSHHLLHHLDPASQRLDLGLFHLALQTPVQVVVVEPRALAPAPGRLVLCGCYRRAPCIAVHTASTPSTPTATTPTTTTQAVAVAIVAAAERAQQSRSRESVGLAGAGMAAGLGAGGLAGAGQAGSVTGQRAAVHIRTCRHSIMLLNK